VRPGGWGALTPALSRRPLRAGEGAGPPPSGCACHLPRRRRGRIWLRGDEELVAEDDGGAGGVGGEEEDAEAGAGAGAGFDGVVEPEGEAGERDAVGAGGGVVEVGVVGEGAEVDIPAEGVFGGLAVAPELGLDAADAFDGVAPCVLELDMEDDAGVSLGVGLGVGERVDAHGHGREGAGHDEGVLDADDLFADDGACGLAGGQGEERDEGEGAHG
jgi:hypothetical protein